MSYDDEDKERKPWRYAVLIAVLVVAGLAGCAKQEAVAVKRSTTTSTSLVTTTTKAPVTTTTSTTTTTVPKPKPHFVTLFNQRGSGDASPQAFTVTGQEWALAWVYNCSNYGGSGNFSVEITRPGGGFTSDIGPNQLASSGHSVDYYYDKGNFQLQILSECNWIVRVGQLVQ